MDSINSRIAEELGVRPQQVEAAVALLDEGSTVPFIARYRKEVTGSLDDTQLRTWKSACATCENSTNGAPASSPASRSRAS
jgi:transcriptional accessory protein Tex/SPT6